MLKINQTPIKKSRRKFSSKFKATVAIEALKERQSIVELASRLQVHSKPGGPARSGWYYKPAGESEQNLALMHLMDRLFTEDPTTG